jgi:ArsR family transcriptional regulator
MKELMRVLKAMADENRVRILKMLQHRKLCVCELSEALGITQPSVSRHLKILQDAGLVEGKRNGQWVDYQLTADGADPYSRAMLRNIKKWLEDDRHVLNLIEHCAVLDRNIICSQ